MDKTVTPVKEKKTKKQVRQKVYEKLAVALADFKHELKEKKFESNLRKASKLFAADLSKARKVNGLKKKKVEANTTEKG